MNIPSSIAAAQLQDLLERLEHRRVQRAAGETESAAERARAILRNARREARARVREAVAYERARLAEALERRRAEHEAERRQGEQGALRELVRRACELLPATVARRWNEPAARRAWCEAALLAAQRRLLGSDWTIEIAPGVPVEEQAALRARAEALRAGKHTVREQPDIMAGIRVRAAGATLDAATAGLLDDRSAIAASILREWLHDAPPAETRTAGS